MSSIKTIKTDADVRLFIESFADTEQKKKDAYTLLAFMQQQTSYEPCMWGPSIIGFGQYHYKSDRSKQEGDWPLVGFSPRKTAISLYVYAACEGQDVLVAKLGKFKMGKGCIYVKKLSDIDLTVLARIIDLTIQYLQHKYPMTTN